MANSTPKISGAGIGIFIEETPSCTPVPQASSTVAHRNSDCVPAVIHEDLKTVYQAIHLKGAIDGLESFSNKFRNAKSQFYEQNKTSVTKSIGVMPPTERCTGVGAVVSDSDADSSLGILKEDEMPDLSEDELDSKGKLPSAHDSHTKKKIVDTAELSDLAVDMRLRLQKELAWRAINRVSFSSYQSEAGNLTEPEDTDLGNELFQNVPPPVDISQSVSESGKVATRFSGSLRLSNFHSEHGHTKEILEDKIGDKIDGVSQSLNLSGSSCSETLQNPFDHLKLDSESTGKMAAMMIALSAEDFMSGDKCEEKLAADEIAWKKENIPPAVGPTSAAISNLDFSGIVGNAEISLPSVDASHCGHPKKRVSVGEFFRLKSEQLDGLVANTNFGMQAKSPEKGHRLFPLKEVELDGNAPQEVSGNNQDCTKQTEGICKSLSFSDGRKSSLHSSEHSIDQRDTLSLSCIADILAKVDTCGSPRTVVSNILKQSGLCSSKGFLPVKNASAPQPLCSSSISDGDGKLKHTSVVGNANVYSGSKKEYVSSLSHSKCDTTSSISGISTVDHSRKGVPVLNVQKAVSHTEVNVSDCSDEKGKLSYSSLTSLSYDGDDSAVSNENSDGWVFSVPNASVGVGAILCSSTLKTGQKNESALTFNKEDKNNDQTFTLEDNISSGDLNIHVENKQLGRSIGCLTQELSCMPEKSVECSGLVSALKKKYPELRSHLSEVNMKNTQSGDKPELDLSIRSVESYCKMSINSTEGGISVQSVMSTSYTPTSELCEYNWVSLRTPSPTPVVCAGVPYDLFLPVHNVTDHWILCGLELDAVKLIGEEDGKDYQFAVVELPSKRVLMDPNNCKEAKVKVVPLCEGKLKISLKVHLNDVVTKAMQSTTCDVFVIGEEPQIMITKSDNSDMSLDFGVLPEECAKEISLKFHNRGAASIPLKLVTVHQAQDRLSTFVLLDPEKQKNKNMAESEVSRELTFTLMAGNEINVTVMFAALPIRLLTKTAQKGFVKLSGVLSLKLIGIIEIELESFKLIGSVGTTKLGIFRPAIPMQLAIKGPGKSDTCHLPMRNHGLVPLTLDLQLLPSDTESVSMTVEPGQVELQPGEQVEPIIRFTSSRPLKEPVQRMLQITMQPHGPVYFVEVTGVMTATGSQEIRKPKFQPEQVVATTKDSLCKSESDKHLRKALSYQSSKGCSSVKSACSSGQSKCSCEWHSIKSQKSNSDGSTAGEKLNVRTTHRQLVWGSVAVGKSVTKSFAIRSEDCSKLAVYVYVEDKLHSYELIDSDGLVMGEKCITLLPKKSHSFRVNFKPQEIGAASAKLVFIIQGIHLIIPMYGFGGHARLIAKGVPRDGAGRMWLMLHQDPHKTVWETSFSLQNFGDLKAFIKIKPISKGFQNLSTVSLIVEPSELVMLEGTSAKIKVTYEPQKQDLKLLLNNSMKDVTEIAALSLVSGDEATRRRLRRIHEKNLDMAKRRVNGEHPAHNIQLDLQPLCAQFLGEDDHKTPDVMSLKDPQESALELYNAGVNHQEIILLLENATDGHSVDATQAFQSMYQYVVNLSTTRQEDFSESPGSYEWNIHPSTLTLQPPHLTSVPVLLWTYGIHKQHFEVVVLEHPPGFILNVSPNAGIIPTSDSVELTITCTEIYMPQTTNPNFWKGVVKIYIENDFKELNICIQYPPTHKKGVLSKNLVPRGSCNVGQHHAHSSLHVSSHSRTSTLSTPALRKKRLTNDQLSHNVHAGTGTKKLSAPKISHVD